MRNVIFDRGATGRRQRPLVWLAIAFSMLLVIYLGVKRPVARAGPPEITAIRIEGEIYSLLGAIRPTDIASAGDGRLFVAGKDGNIVVVLPGGTTLATPFLDIEDRVQSTNLEEGLLGLVFHPEYANNRYFYVSYTNLEGHTVISRFRTLENYPNRANPDSERQLLTIEQEEILHKGGDMAFGPDGYLYITIGDGGWYGDPENNAQNGSLLYGSVLRLDMDRALPYEIPADNPYVDDPTFRDELWAKGLRNPWRFSFDRLTGDMFIGDVGDQSWEEINWHPAGTPGGLNYGWHCYEGSHPFNLAGCLPADSYQQPIYEYGHGIGNACAVVGGYVYRGSQSPLMYGHYLFADFCSRMVQGLVRDGNGAWRVRSSGFLPFNWSSFGEAADGELYGVGSNSDRLYHLTASEITLQRQVYLPLVRQ